jgi:hypothetical protein
LSTCNVYTDLYISIVVVWEFIFTVGVYVWSACVYIFGKVVGVL